MILSLVQSPSAKTESKNQPNGHISSELSRPSEKKAPKKVTLEQPSPSKQTKTVKKLKNKKNQDINEVEVDDKDSGEWVELISKKERKNRKQKEEQLLMESIESKANKEDKSSDKSHQKSSKKNKTPKTVEMNGTIAVKTDESARIDNNETLKSDDIQAEELSLNNDSNQNGMSNAEELMTDLPDIYGLAKEQRVPKKSQKQRNPKRNSESELNSKSEPIVESETKPNLNLSDKLTAAIVANYEGIDNKADNVSNRKDKKIKKKQQKENKALNETNDKKVSNSEKIEEKSSKEVVIENLDSVSEAIVAIGNDNIDG